MRVVLFVCTMLLALPCAAAEPAGVRELLSKPAVLRGEFEQSRHLHGFHNPLVSQGDFLLARDRGVVWMTRKPFASTTLITKDRLQEKVDAQREAEAEIEVQIGPADSEHIEAE